MKSIPSPRFFLANKSKRVFLLTFVSLVAFAALLSFAVSANRANRAAKARAELAANTKSAISPNVQNDKQRNAPTAAVISATLTDNVTPATKVVPGGTINYTAVISNTGAGSPADDATSVLFSAALDANTTFVANSAHASPIATNNAYTTVGNTLLEAGVAPSGNPAVISAVTLFTNDTIATPPDTIQLVSFTAASANGGTVSVNADGSFTYLPPVGFTGSDTFTYTIRNSTDATLTDTGIVTVTVGAPRVWYVNNSGANGDGRSTSPFNTLANAAAVDAANDIIYIFTGVGNYTGGITLLNGEQVIGNGVALVVNTFTLRAAGSRPTVVSAGNGITLASANTLSGFNFGNCTGFAFQGGAVGALAVNNMLINTTGGAFDITAGGSSVNVVLDSTTSSGGTKNVNIATANGTVTLGSGALSGASGNAFDVTGAGTAGITFSGTITNVAAARVVNISGKTGGTVALSGLVTGTTASTGINLATNTGATINFTGGVNLNAPTAGFAATGPGPAAASGGTVSVTDPNALGTAPDNTIVTTTGTALNVTHTTIGAGGLNFRSISANGAANGIFLNNTGASGSLIVSGDGSNTTKGGNASGGTIQNINGADGSTNGIAIYLNNTSGAQLRRITVSGTIQNQGVYGELVNNLTIQYCNIGGTIGTTSGANDLNLECPVEFGKTAPAQANGFASGSVSTVDNCLISGGIQHNMEVYQQANTASLTISNSNITNNGAALGSDGINIETHTDSNGGTPFAQLTVSVQSCLFDNNKSQALQGNALGDSFLNLTVNSSTIQRTTQGNEGFVIQVGGDADLTTHVTNNTFTGILGTNILVGQVVNNASNLSNLIGVIQSNNMTVGNAVTFPTNRTLIVFFSSTIGLVSTANVLVNANTINTFSDPVNGIAEPLFVSTPDANTDPAFTATVTNNVVNITDTTGLSIRGIAIQSTQNVSAGCIDVRGNDVNYAPVTPAGINGIRVRQVNPATLQMEQGGAAGTAAARLAANNPLSTTEVVGTVTVVADNTCLTAPTIPEPVANNVPDHLDRIVESYPSTSAIAQANELAKPPVTASPVAQVPSKPGIASVTAKATPKAPAAELKKTYRGEGRLSHHAVRSNFTSPLQNAPLANLPVAVGTLPAGKTVTIKYQVTVNSPPLARSVSSQGTVTGNGPGAFSVQTDDTDLPGAPLNPTVTLIDTLMTWNGVTSTDWNTATNWTPPAGGTQYAPGVSNPAVNDVVIPNVGAQPNISATDIGIYSLNISNGRTLTITPPRVLTIGGSPGGDLTLDGIISGGNLNLGTGAHAINNAGGTGSLSSTNVATVLSGSTVTLNNNLQAGALAVNAGGSMTIANRILSLNGTGGLVVPGGATFTTTGSTVIFNGTAAQQAAGIAYNNLTINNTAAGAPNALGATLAGNATVNGVLALTSNDLNTGGFTLTQPNTTASTGAGDVVGAVQRTGGPFGLISLTFGNPNNVITFTGAGTRPTTMTVVMAKAAPATYAAAVQRNYTISQTVGAGFTATVRLHYLDSELNGNTPETALGLRRLRTADSHWVAAPPPPGVPTRDGAANWIEATGVLAADLTTQWTFSTLVPTASDGSVTGRIVDQSGNPVEGAVVRLEGTQNRKFITDANGFYRFDNVATNGFYTVTPSRANYSFTPSVRSFSQIGESTEAAFGATLSTSSLANPLDTPEYFVRQHYVDFLNREPDEAGFNFWSDQIIECGPDQNCFERRRENVSAAFFLSIEFQRTGGVVDGLYRAAYGARPDFAHFLPDTRTVGLGVQVGKDGWEALLAANTEAFVKSFVNRAEFHAAYDNLSNADYVDTLISHTGVSFTAAERDALLSGLGAGSMTRAEALRSIAENRGFVNAKFNETFVMMEYFGYLRRDADASGFAFWLNKLNQFNGNFEQAEMVKAFIVSGEYRDRFPR